MIDVTCEIQGGAPLSSNPPPSTEMQPWTHKFFKRSPSTSPSKPDSPEGEKGGQTATNSTLEKARREKASCGLGHDIRWQQLTVYCLSERNSDLLVTTNLLKTGCYVGFFGFVFLLKIRIFFFLSNCDDPWLRDYIPIFPFPSLVSMFAS